jgi:hypothetical protein
VSMSDSVGIEILNENDKEYIESKAKAQKNA